MAKERIIEIAGKLFSQRGYDGVSMGEIAKAVGLTKAAIYYHFKDKKALYEAVILSRLDKLVERIERIDLADPTSALRSYIITYGTFLQEYPCFASLLARELIDGGVHMRESFILLAKTLEILTKIINEGIDKKLFEPSNPMLVQMMIVSTLLMHQTTYKVRERVSSLVDGYPLLPEPKMEQIAQELASKIEKIIRRDRR